MKLLYPFVVFTVLITGCATVGGRGPAQVQMGRRVQYKCQIQKQLFRASLWFYEDSEVAAKMDIEFDHENYEYLKVSANPFTRVDYDLTKPLPWPIQGHEYEIPRSDANEEKGYTLYVSADGKVGLDSTESFGTKLRDNCKRVGSP